jgi:hypothetical protein
MSRQYTIEPQKIKRTAVKLANKVGIVSDEKAYTTEKEFFKELKTFNKKQIIDKMIVLGNRIEGFKDELISNSYREELRRYSKRTLIRALIELTRKYQNAN